MNYRANNQPITAPITPKKQQLDKRLTLPMPQ